MGIRNVALNPYISAGRGSIANLGVTNEQMFNLFKDLSDMILSLYYKDNIIFIEKNLFHIVKKIVTGGNSLIDNQMEVFFYEPKQCISRKSHKETNARVLQKFRE